ncbi:hypothetical protein ACNFBR_16460 [Pseudomonas sp. NY11955]|uniref:hypothetical protein n=1 Tax=Pseudomonas sp. NY11955 TaxID=3400363 RepID=UPI003A846A8F
MANNQDKGGNQGNTNAGQQGGQGSGGGMPDQHQQGANQTGQKPDDKMNKEGDRTRDTGSQGGKPEHSETDKQNMTDKGRMGGEQSQSDKVQWDKDR